MIEWSYIKLAAFSLIAAMVLGGTFLMARGLRYGRGAMITGLIFSGAALIVGIIQVIAF